MYTGHKTTAFDAQVCSIGYKNKGVQRERERETEQERARQKEEAEGGMEGEIMINAKSWRPAAASGLLLQPSRATRAAFFHFHASHPAPL